MSDSGSDHSVSLATPATVTPPVGPSLRVRNRWTAFRTRVPFVVALVLVAFLLRVVAAVAVEQALYAAGRGGFLGTDDIGYDQIAWQQTQAWKGIGPEIEEGQRYNLHMYTYITAGLYLVTGHQPLAMKLVNCLLGALAAGLIYLITRQLFNHLAACFSGIATAFFPSAFFWSVVHMKDVMFLFVMALLMWLVTKLVLTAHRRLILPVLLLLALVGGLRLYIQGLVSGVIPLTVLLQSRARFSHKWATSALLLLGCATILWSSGSAKWLAEYFPLLDRQRYNMAGSANSAYVPTATVVLSTSPSTPVPASAASSSNPIESTIPLPDAPTPDAAPRTSSLASLLRWIPTGLAYALMAPFPWAADRTIERITIPEMLIWYVALILAVLGIAVHWCHWQRYVHLLGYIAGILLLFAIGQGNLGTLTRHRGTMLVPFVFVFSGAGAAWLWLRWRSRPGAASPTGSSLSRGPTLGTS